HRAMTLSEFVLENIEPLLEDWTRFARTVPAARELDVAGLRDHAEAMLRAIAADMLVEQSADQQRSKSEGAAERRSAADTAAEMHGSARRRTGFELVQMVAEFRALRATVVRQWLLEARPTSPEALLELVRFNEALDQAISESLARYVAEIDEARDLFLGLVAHDMRSPIGASMNAARYLKGLPGLDATASGAVDVVLRSDERLSALTADILELVQLKLHHMPPFVLAPVDLGALAASVIAALRIRHPGATVALEPDGDLRGEWDEARLERVLANLVENAVKHGATDAPVTVRLAGEPDAVELTVSNAGEPIPEDRLPRVFEPMKAWSGEPGQASEGGRSYGLGLFIAREIVRGHSGQIHAESSREHGTTFRVRLPRHPRTPGGGADRDM
nr:sensor histidine kinase [Solirubrobacteraceae bacterium]